MGTTDDISVRIGSQVVSSMVRLANSRQCLQVLLIVTMVLHTGHSILCSQCDSDEEVGLLADCSLSPPPPINCSACSATDISNCLPNVQYDNCYTIHTYGVNDTLLSVVRGCMPLVNVGDGCTSGEDEITHAIVKVCRSVCGTDGCNRSPPSALPSRPLVFSTALLATCVFCRHLSL